MRRLAELGERPGAFLSRRWRWGWVRGGGREGERMWSGVGWGGVGGRAGAEEEESEL